MRSALKSDSRKEEVVEFMFRRLNYGFGNLWQILKEPERAVAHELGFLSFQPDFSLSEMYLTHWARLLSSSFYYGWYSEQFVVEDLAISYLGT